MNLLLRHPDTYTDEELSFEVHRYVSDQIAENSYLDYKETVDLGTKSQRIELARDVAAFANSHGGVILYGVPQDRTVTDGGIPMKPYGMGDTPGFADRVLDVLADTVMPRLPEVRVRKVPVYQSSKEEVVYLVWQPKSWLGPHMVIGGGDNRYYRRGAGRRLLMDESDVRSLYLEHSQRVAQQDKIFRDLWQQWNAIAGNFTKGSKSHLYIVPHYLAERLQVDQETTWEFSRRWARITHSEWIPSVNGMSSTGPLVAKSQLPNHFVEVWRNGIIRSVRDTPISVRNDERILADLTLLERILLVLEMAGDVYEMVAYQGPVRIRLEIEDTRDLVMAYDIYRNEVTLNYGSLFLDIDERVVDLRTQPHRVLRKLADRLYQSFGVAGADRRFDDDDKLIR